MTLAQLQAHRASAKRIAECCRMRAGLELIGMLVQVPVTEAQRRRIQTIVERSLVTPANDAALEVVVEGLRADVLALEPTGEV